ncbi:uncharacterized protein LOC110692867 [Chenopodium quinoa]|uniref:uncharacterized protein LOC110692867 n=1 Tax=Chenopodium quinoa TaxID=63459 RepID=UPI000B789D60|nr:uncharacterized protein LOC110692867 [Chenopodium quinoa]
MSAIRYFFAHGYLLKEWNRTFFTLLPKVDHPETPPQFRPIGLCNVLYKCIAKCLSHRLRRVLPSLISDTQNAFVPGRIMADNGLLAHELLSFMNSSNSKACSAALKLDMNKAYDRVNWEFLWEVLRRFGFPPYWVHILQQCVTTVSYQILVNGSPSRPFKPKCGLRQGDPLSPYLFVLCMEIFSLMLRRDEQRGLFQGLKISRRAPSMINVQKSFVKFGSNTPDDFRDYLSSALRMEARSSLGSYLGLPVELGRSKCQAFQFLLDKVVQRLSYYASLNLSSAAKLSGKDTKGLALASSTILQSPKGLGGLGIRHLRSFNQALLAKQSWRFMRQPQLLASRVLKAKYPNLFSHSPSLSVSRPSWGGQGLLEGSLVLSKGLAWKVGSGENINILSDSWIPHVKIEFKEDIPDNERPRVVAELLLAGSRTWNTSLIHQLFPPLVASSIIGLDIPREKIDDFVYWKYTKDGLFSTKSTYSCLVSQHFNLDLDWSTVACWKQLWGTPFLPKWKMFAWRIMHNVLPMTALLALKGLPVDPTCIFCRDDSESVIHLFRDFRLTHWPWEEVKLPRLLTPSVSGPWQCGSRIVIRGGSGDICDMSICFDGARDAITHQAGQHASRLGVSRVLLLTDCSVISRLLLGPGIADIIVAWVIKDIRALLESFTVCHMCKVPKASVS